jgi:O-succinylbenzoic acid--CoA ligase
VASWLERAAALRPATVAVEAPEGALTYAELLERARSTRIASPRVALALPAGLDFAVALDACLLCGVSVVPVDLREPEWRLAGAGQVIEAVENGGQVRGDGASLVIHTSGTTGVPRAVSIGLSAVLWNALGCAVALGHDPLERWLCPLPLSHVGGLMVLLRSVIYGTTAVLGPADRDDVTVASLVPTQLARLIDRPPPPSLRVVMLGGAPADPSLLTRAREAGWPVAPTYGMTQTCSAVTVAEVGDTETSGAPLPGVDISIAPDGEILVAGRTVAGGGVLHTGDLGRLDEHGRLVVLGRKVDTIVSGGENVMPSEVEAVLLSHPAVAEAGVFSRPDQEWGEAVTAHVVLRTDLSPDELRAFAAERLARFKVPKTIEPVAALPRNAAGKLLRRELR